MILLKKVIEGKEIYEPISKEEALKMETKDDLIFTDQNEKNEFFGETKNSEESNKEDNDSFSYFKNVFNKKNKKINMIYSMLPFMNEEDLHEIVNGILNNQEEYKGLNVISILPFLSEDDCDVLFIKEINDKKNKFNLTSFLPFVSEECLSNFVDEYTNGMHQDIDILDNLYPFLSSNDIKKLFKYISKRTFND